MQGESNYHWAREAVKWGADFMVKSVEEGRVLLHIGDIKKDHGYLGRAEDYPQIDRNIVHCAPSAPRSAPRPFAACIQKRVRRGAACVQTSART